MTMADKNKLFLSDTQEVGLARIYEIYHIDMKSQSVPKEFKAKEKERYDNAWHKFTETATNELSIEFTRKQLENKINYWKVNICPNLIQCQLFASILWLLQLMVCQ